MTTTLQQALDLRSRLTSHVERLAASAPALEALRRAREQLGARLTVALIGVPRVGVTTLADALGTREVPVDVLDVGYTADDAGRERVRRALESDLVLLVTRCTDPLGLNDEELLQLVKESRDRLQSRVAVVGTMFDRLVGAEVEVQRLRKEWTSVRRRFVEYTGLEPVSVHYTSALLAGLLARQAAGEPLGEPQRRSLDELKARDVPRPTGVAELDVQLAAAQSTGGVDELRRELLERAGPAAVLARAEVAATALAGAARELGAHEVEGEVMADLERIVELRAALPPAPSPPSSWCPRSAPAWVALGDRARMAGDKALAMECWTRALELDPADVETRYERGKVRLMLGDPHGAREDLERVLELRPDHPKALGWRAEVRAAKGDFEGALADATQSLERTPDHPTAWVARARAREGLGKLAALEDLDRALQLAPDDPYYLAHRASLREQTGDLTGALADLDAAVKHGPGLHDLRRHRDVVRKRLGLATG